MKKLSLIGLVLGSALMVPLESALAHSVQTDYLLSEDNGLALDITFSTGEPVADAPVKIYSPDNASEPWMEGTTDADGKFNFLPDQAKAGEWTVKIGEFDHGDILSVPVEKDGIQIDDISQSSADVMVAQNPLTLKTLPAEAVTPMKAVSSYLGYEELLFSLFATGTGVLVFNKLKK